MPASRIYKRRACESCRSKKITCNGQRPRCEWCKYRGLTCLYRDEEKPVEGQHSDTDMANASSSAAYAGEGGLPTMKVPAAIAASSSTREPKANPISVRSPPSPRNPLCPMSYGGLHFAGCNLGDISSHNGIPVFSTRAKAWIEQHAGTSAFRNWEGEEEMTTARKKSAVPVHHPRSKGRQTALDLAADELAPELPARKTVEACFAIYRDSMLRFVFPVLDLDTFDRTVELAFDGIDADDDDDDGGVGVGVGVGSDGDSFTDAKACVLAFVAVLSALEPDKTGRLGIDSGQCVRSTYKLLLSALREPTIDGFRAAMMLLIHQDFSGQLQSAALVHSLCCRCATFFLSLPHSTETEAETEVEAETEATTATDRRPGFLGRKETDLLWLCYFFDKHLSLRTGQPPLLNDDYYNLDLPADYLGCSWTVLDQQWSPTAAIAQQHQPQSPLFPGDLHLAKLKSTIIHTLYSPNALLKPDAQLFQDIRELDAALETWRLSVMPAALRPSLASVTLSLEGHVPRGLRMFVIFTHFEYFFLLAGIHRAASRSRAWQDKDGFDGDDVYVGDAVEAALHTSVKLSVAGSRSILQLLKICFWDIHTAAFWLIIFYPMWATVNIFCNILHSPDSPEAESDLDLLRLLPSLVQMLQTRKIGDMSKMHLESVEMFIAELLRIAECARESEEETRSNEL